jgi:rsbT co-antagonist protein RsbR
MHITQRQSTLVVFGVIFFFSFIASLIQIGKFGFVFENFIIFGATLLTGALLLAYWKGWEHASYVLVVLMLFVVITTPSQLIPSYLYMATLILPTLVALILLPPLAMLITTLVTLIGFIFRAQDFGIQLELLPIALIILQLGGLICARLVLETSSREAKKERHSADLAARRLRQANLQLEKQVEARTAQLRARAEEQEKLMAEQAALLKQLEEQQQTIVSLSVPVIPVSATTAVVPLIGTMDSERLQLVQKQAMRALEEMSVRRVVLDITGVPVVDSEVAEGILKVVQMARLLGTEVALVGIRPEVAQAMVSLGIDFQDLRTYRDLASVLH